MKIKSAKTNSAVGGVSHTKIHTATYSMDEYADYTEKARQKSPKKAVG